MAPKPDRMKVRELPAAHRDFDSDDDTPQRAGPTFKLGGEEFRCVAELAGAVLPNLVRSIAVDDRGKPVSSPDVMRFMEDVIAEELPVEGDGEVWEPCDDLERWRALMRDKRRPIHAEKLAAVVGWLIDWYTGRPTKPSAP